jgi:hypothetical protein
VQSTALVIKVTRICEAPIRHLTNWASRQSLCAAGLEFASAKSRWSIVNQPAAELPRQNLARPAGRSGSGSTTGTQSVTLVTRSPPDGYKSTRPYPRAPLLQHQDAIVTTKRDPERASITARLTCTTLRPGHCFTSTILPWPIPSRHSPALLYLHGVGLQACPGS